MMLRHLIFHLNILADPALLRAYYRLGLSNIMQARYGNSQQFWSDIQQVIFEDWESYHADLNYSGDEGVSDMREGQFRVTRALFRLAQIPEPPKEEITQLADDLIAQSPKYGDAFFPVSHDILTYLQKKSISTVILSYYPEKQIRAILSGAYIADKITLVIGADTFEHYEMDTAYFEYLLNKLQSLPHDCLYVDKQTQVLATAQGLSIKILPIQTAQKPDSWFKQLQNCFD